MIPLPSIAAPASQSVAANGDLQFDNANANSIAISDSTSGSTGTEQLTLIATHGILELSSMKRLTVTAGANNSATMTIQGPLANVNAALIGLQFIPTAGYSGSASINLNYVDLTDNLTATWTIAITVTSSSGGGGSGGGGSGPTPIKFPPPTTGNPSPKSG